MNSINCALNNISNNNNKSNDLNITTTENGAFAYKSTNSKCLDLFFKLVRHATQSDVEQLFNDAWLENPHLTMAILLHNRDCRKGKGEREITTHALMWLRKYKPTTYLKNLSAFIEEGYYKDLLTYAKLVDEDTKLMCSKDIVELEFFAEQLLKDNEDFKENKSISLAAKWAPTEKHKDDKSHFLARRLASIIFPDNHIKNSLKQYRLLLTKLRNHISITESLMCHNKWNEIKYENVPSKSHLLHKKAFKKHDKERYETYLNDVMSNKKK